MALLDNKLVQLALVFLAFYVVLQIMNKDVRSEHMDTLVTVIPEENAPAKVDVQQETGSPAQVTVQQSGPRDTLITVNTPPSVSGSLLGTLPTSSVSTPLITPQTMVGSAQNASASAVVTAAPSAALDSSSAPSPLTSVEETLLAAAPAGAGTVTPTQNIFAPEPIEYDELFGKRDTLDPAELIVKNDDAELYGGLKPDPKLKNNFLQSRFSLGIDVSKPKHGSYVGDLRGGKQIPMTLNLPFSMPTIQPDLYRKSLADIS